MTTTGPYRRTAHWYVAAADDTLPMHLVFTPVAENRIADMAALMLDEREDLFHTIRGELSDRDVDRYDVLARCWPGTQLEVHLMSRPPGPCPGLPVAGVPDDEMGLLLDLAHAVQCPLCGTDVRQWRISRGVMGHDPGE